MDWTDEVKARLGQVLDSVAATQIVIFPGGAVLRAADIRAALEEIERRGNALDMYEHEVQGMKKRANRDEVLLSVKEQDRLDAHAAKEKAEAMARSERDHIRDEDRLAEWKKRAEAAEADRDEWRETAARRMLGRRAAEAELAEALASETALEAEVKRLTALLDVSERKLGEWRERDAEAQQKHRDRAKAVEKCAQCGGSPVVGAVGGHLLCEKHWAEEAPPGDDGEPV